MLDPPDLELLVDDLLALRRISRPELEQAREQHVRIALEPRIAIAELEPRRGLRLDAGAIHRCDRAFDRELADVLTVAARVAVHRATHRARYPGGELEPGDAVIAAAEDQIGEVGAALDVHGAAVELDGLARVVHDQPAKALVRHQQVAASPEQEHRQPDLVAGAECRHQLIGGDRGEEEVGRSADPERGVVPQRLLGEEPRAERAAQAVFDGGDRSRHVNGLAKGQALGRERAATKSRGTHRCSSQVRRSKGVIGWTRRAHSV